MKKKQSNMHQSKRQVINKRINWIKIAFLTVNQNYGKYTSYTRAFVILFYEKPNGLAAPCRNKLIDFWNAEVDSKKNTVWYFITSKIFGCEIRSKCCEIYWSRLICCIIIIILNFLCILSLMFYLEATSPTLVKWKHEHLCGCGS